MTTASRSSGIQWSEVSFDSDGVRCAADLYLPETGITPVPCVVMAHGFSGTKDGLRLQARGFAAAGVAALVFDYRHFGASDGSPRQLIDVARQQADYRAAIRFARVLPGVDGARVAVWGTSLSGGHVIAVAAQDPSIAAVVAQVPWVGIDFRSKDPRGTGVTLRLFAAALLDAIGAVLGTPPLLLPVIGEPGELAAFNDPRAKEAIQAMAQGSSGWLNSFTARTLFGLLRYRPGSHAAELAMPLLVCIAEQDVYAPPALAIRAAHEASRGELRRYPTTHFDAYLSAADQLLSDQTAFLRQYLLRDADGT